MLSDSWYLNRRKQCRLLSNAGLFAQIWPRHLNVRRYRMFGGTPTDKAGIWLQGMRLSITQNLSAALHRLRLPKEPRVFWVDAICINQDDVVERNQHIGIMRHIYKSAREVMVWVGEEADD